MFENYKAFPKVDCGYCGNSSCISMLRRHCAGEDRLSRCIFFQHGILNEDDFRCELGRPMPASKPSVSFVRPCPSSPDVVAAELSLARPENARYGYFDMYTAEKFFGPTSPEVKVSTSLGLARTEPDGRAVMAFSNGRVLIRRARTEEDAFWHLSRMVRLLWAAVN